MDKFIFLHVMKTGGTTLLKEFIRIYGRENILHETKYKQDKIKNVGLLRMSDKTLTSYFPSHKDYKIIHGHFFYEKYKHLRRPFFTFLRNPIERIISHYSTCNNIDFYEFCRISSNAMTQMTGGDLTKYEFIGITDKMEESLQKLENILGCSFKRKVMNKTKNKKVMTKNQIKYIKKYNQHDIKLYEKGLNLFAKMR